MAGRHAQPVEMLLVNGKKHLTKDEIQQRRQSEVKFGSDRLVCPAYVRKDPVAHSKWREIVKEYKQAAEMKINLVTSSDVGILAMYCKTYSEYQMLLSAQQRIQQIHYDSSELEDYISGEDEFPYKVKKQLRDLFSISAILTVETAINKKMEMLLKMEDRLFLNPLAKLKNIPKPAPKKPASKFGALSGGTSG